MAAGGQETEQRLLQLGEGTLISGAYRLVQLIGAGGMGQVWECRHERTKARLALKLLLPELGRNKETIARFQQEAEVTSALNHPNIVRVTDFDKLPDGRTFIVMEYLEGRELRHVTASGQRWSPAEIVDIIDQIALGLQAAHARGIIHRDLKPSNIFLTPLPGSTRPVLKILDFGISKTLDSFSNLTQSQSLMGTPHYMAPEQARGGASSLDARADQFALAAIAYELFTGRLAFDGENIMAVLVKVTQDQPESFSALGVTAAAGVEAVIFRGLSKAPSERFPSVVDFAAALKRAAVGNVVTPPRGTALLPTEAPPSALPSGGTLALPPSFTTTMRSSTGQLEAVSDSVATGADRRPRRRVGLALGAAGVIVVAIGVSWIGGGSGARLLPGSPPPPSPRPELTLPASAVDASAGIRDAAPDTTPADPDAVADGIPSPRGLTGAELEHPLTKLDGRENPRPRPRPAPRPLRHLPTNDDL